MIEDQLSPEEQELVRQLQSVSKPKLDAAARAAIRERMVSEFRIVNTPGQLHPLPAHPRIPLQWLAGLAAMIVVAIVGLTLVGLGNQNASSIIETSTLTASPGGQIVIVASETVTPTVESTPSAPANTPVVSSTPEITPTALSTTPVATQVLPSSTPQAPTQVPPSSTPLAPTQIVPSSTPQAPTQDMFITVEGPVISIIDNIVLIYDFTIQVEPQHPILQVIDVGDVVRVQGQLGSDGAVVASIVSNIVSDATVAAQATVGLDGPIESIDGSTIIVNGIRVQLSPDDPLLQTAQPGNFVSVQGNFEDNGTMIVLVVVNIAVINNIVVDGNPSCWYHEGGMGMGHWHCDGMGMGMGDSGMGMGDGGMGMGEGGMGMGMGR